MTSGSRKPGQPGPFETRSGGPPPPEADEERGKVLPFTPRPRPTPPGRVAPEDGSRPDQIPILPTRPAARPPGPAPVADLRRYARTDDPDDFRHRMKTNAAAFLLVLALMGCGYWIASTLADMRKGQDCVLSGRRGCGTVTVPASGP